jgi:hypothetical protein
LHAESDAEREAVIDDYMAILARLHQIDPDRLRSLELAVPTTPEALGLGDFPGWERGYRRRKQRPEPILEFLVRWVRRNVPTDRARACLICSDSGQFLFEGGRVTALLDLELATLGDPMADLAGMLSRDLSEPLGDLSRAFRRYAELSGEPLDVSAIQFHAVRFCTITPLAVAHLVASPPAGVDWIQYLGWYSVWMRAPLEIIAERLGVQLDAIDAPDPVDTRHSPAHVALRAMLAPRSARDAFADYERDAASRIAEYASRAERFGPALEADNLEEAAALLGRRPADWGDADAELEALVERESRGREADLVRLFHRRLQRLEYVLAPVMRELEGAKVQQIGSL